MDSKTLTAHSKFLSFVLRHRPDSIGLVLDAGGWVAIDELVARSRAHGRPLSRAIVEEIAATNPKRRFAISDDGRQIRASQGHSIEVELGYEPAIPPARLFHGTVSAALAGIRDRGLERQARHHVHLSADVETARSVGGRRGRPVVLAVEAGAMQRDGHVFFLSANGVWLVGHVPPTYIVFPGE